MCKLRDYIIVFAFLCFNISCQKTHHILFPDPESKKDTNKSNLVLASSTPPSISKIDSINIKIQFYKILYAIQRNDDEYLLENSTSKIASHQFDKTYKSINYYDIPIQYYNAKEFLNLYKGNIPNERYPKLYNKEYEIDILPSPFILMFHLFAPVNRFDKLFVVKVIDQSPGLYKCLNYYFVKSNNSYFMCALFR